MKVDGTFQSPIGFTKLAVEEIPPILAPGVFLEAAGLTGVEALEPGSIVTAEDLEACCEEQGVSVEAVSDALVHTGNCLYWDDAERYLAAPGMDARGVVLAH